MNTIYILIIVLAFFLFVIVLSKILKKPKTNKLTATKEGYNKEVLKMVNMIKEQSRQLESLDETTTPFRENFYSLSENQIVLYKNALSSILESIKNWANMVNTTDDIRLFVNAYNAMEKGFSVLERHEFTRFFLNSPPSKNHHDILTKKHYTEIDFLKRAFPNNINSNLLRGEYSEYFYTFTPETIRYIENNGIESNVISPKSFDSMDGHEFEYFCAGLLRKNGYKDVNVTPGSGDQGIDIIAFKDGVKYGIQCKCYNSDIGNKAVQEAYSGKRFYKCHVAAVLTNRYFTKSAKELAESNGVLLWDRDKLEEMNV